MDYNEGHIMVIDKPLGWTSADVVRKVKFHLRRIGYRNIKVGHAGTLDPLATGVLILCLGRATKQVEALQAEEKEYEAEIVLGATTPSYDREHEVDATYPTGHITRERVEEALRSLEGEQWQTPPLYSAKMVEGRRAYELAREGTSVVLRRSLVHIYRAELTEWAMPRIRVRVVCSRGTYIRSLARDLGERLESGAYLWSLRRMRSGGYRVEEALTVEEATENLVG